MSNESAPIYYALNVSLFAFTLQSGSYLDSQELINESPQTFQHKYEKILKDNFSNKLNFPDSFPQVRQYFPDSDNYELLTSDKKGTRQFLLLSSKDTNQNPIQPKPLYRLLVYPQKLSDNYALLLNIFRPQAEGFDGVKLNEVGEFNPNQCLTLQNDAHFIGQTFLITAYVSVSKPTNPEDLKTHAENLLGKLFGGVFPDFYQADNFLDGCILEFSRPKKSQTRYLVLFYFSDATSEQLKEIYLDLPELFLYYHKITNVFQRSRTYSDQLDKLIQEEIESKSKLPDNLDLAALKTQLKELLKTVPKYTSQLRNLEDCLNTLNIHARNYQLKLKRLQSAVSDDLDLFRRFGERESETFRLQIEADLNYSKPGYQLLDQAISSIRGLVEIDQAESDRKLQQTLQDSEKGEKKRDRDLENTIQAVGTGIGVGVGFAGILAAGYPLIEKPWDFPSPQHPILPPHPFIVAVVFSCLFGGGLGWLAWFWTKRHLQNQSTP
ncbi:hypothetical protein [Tychonema sp. BBK16]|uniref:hypothetical protein n=1 Tax=Tychonema sp. BBK16 TaxID=2699888 RepID=UPI001F2A0542|nr:hypothetical protein [Tychonema sp. BBK16]MCF6375597.1 hypothetical protein [Tychonema sp. BBK16]